MESTVTNPAQSAPKYVHIYMEANPNPASMKFVANFFLLPEGLDYYYESKEEATESPLAQMLFGFDFTDKVFIMSNFVTVTKKPEFEWAEVGTILREAIQDYLKQGKPTVNLKLAAQEAQEGSILTPTGNDTELEVKIKEILDEYIRPAVEGDGGAITLHSFNPENGVVTVTLKGSCSGCPSSTVTLKAGIENLLTRMIPEVKAVEAQAM